MQRYPEMASGSGADVMYKVPGDHKKAALQIEATAKKLGLPKPTIVFI